MLFSVQKRKTCTSFFWPIRCARSMACGCQRNRRKRDTATCSTCGCFIAVGHDRTPMASGGWC
jgi:hypothetical protein